jgi:tRNA (cmo5U34)-methyltransferase
MIKQVINYVECLSQGETSVIDIGCSTGSMLKAINHKPDVTYIGIDNSNLIQKNDDKNIWFIKDDVFNFEFGDFIESSVTTCIFTLQFIARHKRKHLLDKIFEHMVDGGVLIITEKVHMDDPQIESINTVNYLTSKRMNFSDTDILDKADKLTRTLNIRTESELIKELEAYGLVIPFWKNYSFSGYIVRKG